MIATVAVTVGLVSWALAGSLFARRLQLHLPPFAHALGAPIGVLVGFLALAPIIGRWARSFDAALGFVAVSGLVALAAAWFGRGPPTLGVSTRLAGPLLAALVVVGALYARVSIDYQMHDEHALFGHKSMVEELRDGVFPPFLPPFPEQDAPYHYGFDLLAGALARAYGLSSDAAIDASTVALALTMSLAAAALASFLGAARQAGFAALAIHLGAGLGWLLLAGVPGRHPRCLAQYHHPTCGVELFPTPFLNVFQHPVSVGVPLFLTAVLLLEAADRAPTRHARRLLLGALALVFPALMLGQVVYAALFGLGALSARVLLRGRGDGGVSARALTLVLGAGLVTAALAGGMLTPKLVHDSGLLGFRRIPGFPGPSLGAIGWHHAVNLGVGLLALPLVFGEWARGRRLGVVTLASAAFGGILALHLLNYARSWDVVKFPSASAFALSVLYVVLIDPALRAPWSRLFGRVLLVGGGVLSAAFVLFPLRGPNRLYDPANFYVDPGVAPVIERLRAEPRPRGLRVLAQGNIAQQLAVFGGIAVVGQDYDLYTQGVSKERLDEQERLTNRARDTLEPEALEALHVGWLVFSREELQALGPAARARLGGEGREPNAGFELLLRVPGATPARERMLWRVNAGR